MRQVKETGTGISGIYIAPLIDVALVLVLTLLITAPVLNIPNLQINLPIASTEETKERNVTVTLTLEGKMSINSEIVQPSDLVPRLMKILKKDKKLVVIVRADKDCQFSDVQNLIEIIKKRVGARRIAVATKIPETSLHK